VALNLLPLAANADSPAPWIQPQASTARQQSSNTKNIFLNIINTKGIYA